MLVGVKLQKIALVGVAKWIESRPEDQKVTGLIPGQGTHLGSRPGPQLGACERQLISVSRAAMFLSLFFSRIYSLKISKSLNKL